MFLNDSRIYFEATSVVTLMNNFAASYGGAVFLVNNSVAMIDVSE